MSPLAKACFHIIEEKYNQKLCSKDMSPSYVFSFMKFIKPLHYGLGLNHRFNIRKTNTSLI